MWLTVCRREKRGEGRAFRASAGDRGRAARVECSVQCRKGIHVKEVSPHPTALSLTTAASNNSDKVKKFNERMLFLFLFECFEYYGCYIKKFRYEIYNIRSLKCYISLYVNPPCLFVSTNRIHSMFPSCDGGENVG